MPGKQSHPYALGLAGVSAFCSVGAQGALWVMSYYQWPVPEWLPPVVLGVSILLLIMAVTVGCYIAYQSRHLIKKAGMPVPLVLMAFFGIGFIACTAWYLTSISEIATNGSPVIVRPHSHDVRLHFEAEEILPNETPNKPFLLNVSNIGEQDLSKVRLNFEVVGIDLQDLVSQSPVFRRTHISPQGDIWIVTRYNGGTSSKTIKPDISGTRIIDLLPSNSEATQIDMPASIKNALSLFILANTCKEQPPDPSEHNEVFEALESGDFYRLSQLHTEQYHNNTIKLPEIRIKIEWLNETTITLLKSIYQPTSHAMWVYDNRSGKNINYLVGGMGILSYENINEPEQGFYNAWDRREIANGNR